MARCLLSWVAGRCRLGLLTFGLEMAQHVREMALGMFAAHEVFVAHQMDP